MLPLRILQDRDSWRLGKCWFLHVFSLPDDILSDEVKRNHSTYSNIMSSCITISASKAHRSSLLVNRLQAALFTHRRKQEMLSEPQENRVIVRDGTRREN